MEKYYAFNLPRQMAATAAAQTPRYSEQFNEDSTITIVGMFADEEAGERWAEEYRPFKQLPQPEEPKASKLEGIETSAHPKPAKKPTLKNLLKGTDAK